MLSHWHAAMWMIHKWLFKNDRIVVYETADLVIVVVINIQSRCQINLIVLKYFVIVALDTPKYQHFLLYEKRKAYVLLLLLFPCLAISDDYDYVWWTSDVYLFRHTLFVSPVKSTLQFSYSCSRLVDRDCFFSSSSSSSHCFLSMEKRQHIYNIWLKVYIVCSIREINNIKWNICSMLFFCCSSLLHSNWNPMENGAVGT